jgi:hypothetical protein
MNLASSLVTGCSEAMGMGYWAATQVKESHHELGGKAVLSKKRFFIFSKDMLFIAYTEWRVIMGADSQNVIPIRKAAYSVIDRLSEREIKLILPILEHILVEKKVGSAEDGWRAFFGNGRRWSWQQIAQCLGRA